MERSDGVFSFGNGIGFFAAEMVNDGRPEQTWASASGAVE